MADELKTLSMAEGLAASRQTTGTALGIIDRSRGVDGPEPVLRTWPADYRGKIHAGGKEDFDSTRSRLDGQF